MKNEFFKTTNLYKMFVLLDLIDKYSEITQRLMSESLLCSVSTVNFYLDELESMGYLTRNYINSKNVSYHITKSGKKYKKVLNIGFLKSSQKIFYQARDNIVEFIQNLSSKGIQTVYLYGAGEVAEIILQTLITETKLSIIVLGLIDDDPSKIGTSILGTKIYSGELLSMENFDAVVVSSYTHQQNILSKLKRMNINTKKIIKFF